MPGMDGVEFLEIVRKAYPDLPFILFTGKGSEEVASEAIAAGVTDYLQKGSGSEVYELLGNRITNHVERVRAQRKQQRHLDAIETAQEGISRFTSRHWVWYRTNEKIDEREDDRPRSLADTADHGKYLFFTPDETGVLEQIVVDQFLDRPFSSAKVPTIPNRRDEAVLCLYYGDDRYRADLREQYQNETECDTYGVASPYDPEAPVIKPRGFKTDGATRRNEYSDKYRNSE